MRNLVLYRDQEGDTGTFGEMPLGDTVITIGEPPWRGNAVDFSCIPAGKYLVEMDDSPKYGRCYHVRSVPGRTDILLHAGNWCGDKKQNLLCDTGGCLLVGDGLDHINGQYAVTNSREALALMIEKLGGKPSNLEIVWASDINPEGRTEKDCDYLQNAFTYHKPRDGQNDKYEAIRARARSLAEDILNLAPDSRERVNALNSVEAAMFWANAGIARKG